jgi:hypothetical protein
MRRPRKIRLFPLVVLTGIIVVLRQHNSTTLLGQQQLPVQSHLQPHEVAADLPRWATDYFEYHRKQVLLLSETNWQKQRFFILRCLKTDFCGGASDRLQVVPAILRVASESNRLFFIKWDRPGPLESFLLPTTHVSGKATLNWTIPIWLDMKLNYNTVEHFWGNNGFNKLDGVRRAKLSTATVITMLDNSGDHGAAYYNAARDSRIPEPTFQDVYRTLWDALFSPAPAVAHLIEHSSRHLLSLSPSQHYVGLHIRTLFESDESNNRAVIENSVHCAGQLVRQLTTSNAILNMPIYLTTDSVNATQLALAYGRSLALDMRIVPIATSPMHLDRGSEYLVMSNTWAVQDMEVFYPTFVDLYLLGNAAAVSYGIGGFGRWGSLLSKNSSRFIQHDKTKCPRPARRQR